MTKSEIVSMAYEAGCPSIIVPAEWFRFAKLVAAAKREWQGLTDEEIGTLTVFDGLHHVEVPLLASFTRAIEAKLREKNSG